MKVSKACGVAPDALFAVGSRANGKVLEIDRWLLRALLRGVGSPAIGAALWDGDGAVVVKPLAGTALLSCAWFTRHVVLDRWFLHTN